MELTIANVLTIANPTKEAQKWCDANLVVSNPEYRKKSYMGFWLGNTPQRLKLYEKDGNSLVLPYGVLRNLSADILTNAAIDNQLIIKTSVDYGDVRLPLYDYQSEAIEWLETCQYGILQSPAGSGKTHIGIALIKKLGVRALWLTHTAELLNQSKSRAEQFIDPSLLGTITQGQVNIGVGITFATVQTMSRLDLSKYADHWDCIIVDECHRVSGTPSAITQFSKVLNSLSAMYKIGLSATVHRSDGLLEATYAILGNVIYTVPKNKVGDKIVTAYIKPIPTGIEEDRSFLDTDGTLIYLKLIEYLAANVVRNYIIAETISQNRQCSSLILSQRISHLTNIMACLPRELVNDAVMINGSMASKKGREAREQALEDMRTGKKKYLFATYALAKEGLDIPRLERLYMASPQTDYAVITQSIGRITRAFEGKGKPIVYDFVDDIHFLQKSYKKRCSTYRRNKCLFIEQEG